MTDWRDRVNQMTEEGRAEPVAEPVEQEERAAAQADELAALEDRMNDRNCRPVLSVPPDFDPSQFERARPVMADRHGRLWAWHEDVRELRMINDPNAASF